MSLARSNLGKSSQGRRSTSLDVRQHRDIRCLAGRKEEPHPTLLQCSFTGTSSAIGGKQPPCCQHLNAVPGRRGLIHGFRARSVNDGAKLLEAKLSRVGL